MTEFQELVKDAPEFALMGRGELAIYAYAMYAAGAKMEAENAKLRELCAQMVETVECSSSTKRCVLFSECAVGGYEPCLYEQELRDLGIEVDG